MVDLTNKRFGMLVAKERIRMNDAGGKQISKWKCVCDCGKETIVRTTDLTSGQTRSCGCLRQTSVSEAQLDDITGQTFNWLTVIKRVDDYVTRGGFAYTQWLCKCKCGKDRIAVGSRLKNGYVSSCGCKQMSTGESIIDDILFELHVDHTYSYKFKNLVGPNGGLLMFDFAILDNNQNLIALIEYQGIQHYIDGEFGKQQREITDKMKKDYCKTNNIPLYEIRYDENIKQAIDAILQNTIYANTVPSKQEIA